MWRIWRILFWEYCWLHLAIRAQKEKDLKKHLNLNIIIFCFQLQFQSISAMNVFPTSLKSYTFWYLIHRNGETEEVHFRRANFWFGGRFFEQPKMAPPVVVATCSYCGSLWVYVLYVVCLCNVYVCFFDLLGLCCFSKIF